MVRAGYKQTEIGEIPKDWDAKKLQDEVRLLSGHHVLAQYCNFNGYGVPYLTGPADFSNGKIRQTKFTTKPTTLCLENDLLVTVKGSGAGMLIESDATYCISRQLMAIRVNSWNSRFLYYSLLHNASRIRAASAGLIPGLARSDVLEQRLPIPQERLEQDKIAKALSDVDELIVALEQLIAKKRDIKTATMQQLLTGKKRLPGFGEGKDTKQTELGEIPADWAIEEVGRLLSIITGDKNTQDKVDDGKYPFFVRSQIVEKINSYSFDGEAVLTAGDGVGTGKIFHYAKGKLDFHQRVYLMHSFTDKLNGKFFYIYFSNHFYDRIMSMTAKSSVDSVRRDMISKMPIILPPIAEQDCIAKILFDMDEEICLLESRLHKTKSIKQGMMQELLTGRTRLVDVGVNQVEVERLHGT